MRWLQFVAHGGGQGQVLASVVLHASSGCPIGEGRGGAPLSARGVRCCAAALKRGGRRSSQREFGNMTKYGEAWPYGRQLRRGGLRSLESRSRMGRGCGLASIIDRRRTGDRQESKRNGNRKGAGRSEGGGEVSGSETITSAIAERSNREIPQTRALTMCATEAEEGR